jgi:hypothetical protein
VFSVRVVDVVERFWCARPCRLGGRDRVVVDERGVSYLLWGHEIAVWDRLKKLLIVRDCGWQTWLTKDRLNKILCRLEWEVYSDRNQWYIHDRTMDASYCWEGEHTISLDTRQIKPAKRRIGNPKIASRLKMLYRRGAANLEAKLVLATQTLDGTSAYIFADWRDILVVKVNHEDFEAWKGKLTPTTLYLAYARQDPTTILKKLNRLIKIEAERKGQYTIEKLKELGFNTRRLPENLATQLALVRLLED